MTVQDAVKVQEDESLHFDYQAGIEPLTFHVAIRKLVATWVGDHSPITDPIVTGLVHMVMYPQIGLLDLTIEFAAVDR
ncbi:hypothetical protein [Chitinimonas sp. JJ19]|uniref:hypothetical protein n=1 Tax=Chitinimonas sp. JJ19 TaxID=3109352 RepID=UPI0030034A48